MIAGAEWQSSLSCWFRSNRRDLPWRRTRDPYAIWVSEVMLQQTQVDTVIPYFERWMAWFPTVDSLAVADEQEALALWQGLGYYRRCRLLHQGAQFVVEHGMPTNAAGWHKIPGVGRYTAAAIASIAFGESVPLVDGNVERVFARLTGCELTRPKLLSETWRWAAEVLEAEHPGDWNQALMELGATVCRFANPLCDRCPLADICVALKDGRTSSLPAIRERPATVRLEHFVFVPVFEGKLGLRQIPEGRWWQGMWEFPREESEEILWEIIGPGEKESLGTIRHTVTRHRITVHTARVTCNSPTERLEWMSAKEAAALPMPAPARRILQKI